MVSQKQRWQICQQNKRILSCESQDTNEWNSTYFWLFNFNFHTY